MEPHLERLSTHTTSTLAHGRSLDYARWVSALYHNDGREGSAAKFFELCWPRSMSLDLVTKAAVAAGTTTDATWAGPLAVLRPLSDAFLEFVRPQTLIGKIAGLRRVPFNVSVPSQTAAGSYGWIGPGAPTVATKPDFSTVTIGTAKAAGIIIVTRELMKLSSPSADVLLRDELAAGLAQFLDGQFVDPAVAAVANVSPGSITNGTTAIVSAGTTAANAVTDIKALIAAFVAANPAVEDAVLLMKPANAVALSIAANAPTLGLHGGTLYGIPVVTSGSVGDRLILLDARGILLADENGVEVSASQQASIQLDSAPTDPTVAATVLVSLFQQNLAGVKAVRFINWTRGRLSAVKYVSGAAYVEDAHPPRGGSSGDRRAPRRDDSGL